MRITTNVVRSNPVHVIKFVSDLQQVGGFLRVIQFPPPNKTDLHDITEILLNVSLNTINQATENTTSYDHYNSKRTLDQGVLHSSNITTSID
jgi:hypothetical protein